MKLWTLPSRCLISFDPPRDKQGSIIVPTGIVYPGTASWKVPIQWDLRGRPRTGLCVLHCASSSWGDVNLTGKRVIVDRFAGRPFNLLWPVDGKEYTFYNVSQWAVMAVIEEEESGRDQETVRVTSTIE